HIDPLAVGILGDDQTFCTDIIAAIVRMPFRRRKFQKVDCVTLFDVVHDGAGVHLPRRNRLPPFLWFAPVGLDCIEREIADDEMSSAYIRENTKLRIDALDVLEQDNRRIEIFVTELEKRADFEIRIGSLHANELVGLLSLTQEGAQISKGGLIFARR